MILQVLAQEADLQDQTGGKLPVGPLKGRIPRLPHVWTDSAYRRGGFREWVKETPGWNLKIVAHPWSGLRGVRDPKDAVIAGKHIRFSGIHILTWRRMVERTFAWLSTWRRLAKDAEGLPRCSEAWMSLAMSDDPDHGQTACQGGSNAQRANATHACHLRRHFTQPLTPGPGHI